MLEIYHNPKCSKSRDALKYLTNLKLDLQVIEYLQEPLSKEKLKEILKKLNIPAKDLLRKNEIEYKEYNLDDSSLSDDEIIHFMLKTPKLIERPIIVSESSACIARPIEKLIEMLNN